MGRRRWVEWVFVIWVSIVSYLTFSFSCLWFGSACFFGMLFWHAFNLAGLISAFPISVSAISLSDETEQNPLSPAVEFFVLFLFLVTIFFLFLFFFHFFSRGLDAVCHVCHAIQRIYCVHICSNHGLTISSPTDTGRAHPSTDKPLPFQAAAPHPHHPCSFWLVDPFFLVRSFERASFAFWPLSAFHSALAVLFLFAIHLGHKSLFDTRSTTYECANTFVK